MSVQTYKRIITFVVIFALLLFVFLSVFFGIRYFQCREELASPTVIDLADYGYSDAADCQNLILYMARSGQTQSFEYRSSHPDVFIENDFLFSDGTESSEAAGQEKVCYLTFDDGPYRTVTPEILDVLEEYGVKATFFVIYKDSEPELSLYKRIADEGHAIGVHSASHNYKKIYTSVQAYLDDFAKLSGHVEALTGVKPEVFRFPGGSVNSYNAALHGELSAEMIRRGYVYYDWNVDSGDAAGAHLSAAEITENVSRATDDGGRKKIILMHDGPGHAATAEALPDVIEDLKAKGYVFKTLDNSVAPIIFG